MTLKLLQTIALLCANSYTSAQRITKCQVRYIECVRSKEAEFYKHDTKMLTLTDHRDLFLEQCVIEKGRK